MSQYPTLNQTYFSGMTYNPSFFTSSSGVSSQFASNNYLQRIGTNPTSIATQTTFSGSINVLSITATTDSSIQGNLAVSKTLTTNNISSTILTVASPIINLNGSVVCNNSTGIYKFLNMNCPINQVFPTS